MTKTLLDLAGQVDDGESLFYVRLNDGEMVAMFGTRPTTGEDSKVYPEMAAAYKLMLEGLTRSRYAPMIGSSWMTHPDAESELFVDYVTSIGLMGFALWSTGHAPLHGIVTGDTQVLLSDLKGCGRPVFLVGNSKIEPARHCIGAKMLEVPACDSWLVRGRVADVCARAAELRPDAVFVWCAGVGLKPTAWDVYRKYPRTAHLDLGHIFDGLDGSRTREWMRLEQQPWWRPYQTDFLPWVRSFAP